jgi:YegS/Rv2252/BmrU family lipid kinase
MKRWVAVQRNPVAGPGPDRAAIAELLSGLQAHGLAPRLYSSRDRLARRLARVDCREGLECIVAAGGDGTVADVINRWPGVPLAILPLGTENLLARHLGVPRSGRAVADLVAAGRRRRLDLGLLGERRFTLMASAGFDAEVVHDVHRDRAGHVTRGRYARSILRVLARYPFPSVKVWIDGAATPMAARLAIVVNVPAYAGRLGVAPGARDDDGLLDLRLFERGSALHMIRYVVMVLAGAHERLPDVRSIRASSVRIESDAPVPVQADGDPAGRTPMEARVLHAALEVVVPAERPAITRAAR